MFFAFYLPLSETWVIYEYADGCDREKGEHRHYTLEA